MGLKMQRMYRMCGEVFYYLSQPVILICVGDWDVEMDGIKALIEIAGSRKWVLARKLEMESSGL
jgi:hypothetical protein